jgi:hypothetical protein
MLKKIRFIAFKTRQALVLALLLSFSATQMFAMTSALTASTPHPRITLRFPTKRA